MNKSNKINLRSEYEKICPMTTWSDRELLDFLHKQRTTAIKDNIASIPEIIEVESIDIYMSDNKCIYAEDVINEFRRQNDGKS